MPSNSPKNRDYFITANEGAECYKDFEERIKELNYNLYAWIIHDKDKISQNNNETGEIEELPKRTHKHAVIELKNPISFNSIQKKFPGAHIEVPRYKKSAYQYLIHNSPNSKEKYQYTLNEVISNNIAQVKQIIESETFELFYENQFLRYIAQGVRTSYSFAKRFGLNAYRQYWKPYSEMLEALKYDKQMQNDLEEMQQILENELPF